jgi:glycerol uptake facilitator-like aquaporin
MAQTKRKRRTKHRGNAAGMVESRGRTGRAPAPAERKSRSALRTQRFDRPPNWRSAANRSAIATLLFVVVVAVIQKNVVAALAIGILMFFTYTALGYYTDSWIYRRRQAKRAQGKL